MNRIVVIEDDPSILRGLTDTLRAESYDVLSAADGEDGYHLALDEQPDLVILDLMLPRMNGYDICREIRRHGRATPILMLTAQGQETSRVEGFEAGADDYVTKPFAFEELLARVEALARRPRAMASPMLHVGDLELNRDTREVRRVGELIELTPKEYAVLEYLMRHQGRVMSRTLITEYAWGYHFDPGTNIVDVVINHLRKKIDSKHDRKLITTVRGVGYVIKG
jgi:DNA-binding response OmpR family regulator